MPDEKFEAILRSQLGLGFTKKQIELVAKSVEWVECKSGDTIFQQGEPGDSMLLLAQGRVKITVAPSVGEEKFIDYLSVGEHFGEMAILTGKERAVTMTAVMDSRLLKLKRPEFQKLIHQVPKLAANVSRTLGYRLRRETTGQKIRNVSRVIGIVAPAEDANDKRMTVDLVNKLTAAMDEQEICVRVITDHVTNISEVNCLKVSRIPSDIDGQVQSQVGSRPVSRTVRQQPNFSLPVRFRSARLDPNPHPV